MPDMDRIREQVLSRSAEVASTDMAELEAAATESDDPNFLLEVYWLYRQRDQMEDALRMLDKAEESYPEADEAVALQRADIYYHSRQRRQALAIWEEVSRSENETDATYARMKLLYHRNKFRDAIDQYELLVQRDGATHPKHFANVLIPCFLYTRQFSKAKDLCLMMMEARAAFKTSYLGMLGTAEEGLGNVDAAEAAYVTVLGLDPCDLTVMGRLHKLHLRRFRWRSAWVVFRDYIKNQSDKDEMAGA